MRRSGLEREVEGGGGRKEGEREVVITCIMISGHTHPGTLYAAAFALDRDTLKRLKWSEIKVA